jgi:hypothetical protein
MFSLADVARLFALLYLLETLIVTASPLGAGLAVAAPPAPGLPGRNCAVLPHVPRDAKPYLQGHAAAKLPLASPAQPLPAHRSPAGYEQTAPSVFHPLTTGAGEQDHYDVALEWGDGWHCAF